ncbi:MAG TPA: hypothetical protein VHD83_26205 [Puia sp.]|nr:hypothetical protein [Puia sp.]
MRLFLQLIVLIAVGFSVTTACSKKKEPSPGLVGKWKEIQVTGGIAGQVIDISNSVILQLNADSSYSLHISDTLTLSGVYHLSKDTAFGGSPITLIAFVVNSNPIEWKTLNLQNGFMTITDHLDDGYASTYKKLPD